MRPHSGRMTRLSFVSLMLALAAAVPADAASDPEPGVSIRTYNYAQIPDESLARARAAADGIFKRAGIVLRWIDCRVPQSESGAACVEPLDGRRDLVLRLMDRTPHDRSDAGRVVELGSSMLDREQRGGVLMTIDLFPVRAIAREALTDVPTLLGRAIAHEMGHLMLGSSHHPKAGLMRALWSHDELRGIKPAHWQFSAREAVQMRHGLALRARAN
jgi:hypothetical protein